MSMALALATILAAGAPVVEAAPNIYGQTGVVRTTSAEAGGNGVFDVGGSGFIFAGNPYLAGGAKDSDFLTGGHLTLSAAFLDAIELSLALRGAANANTARTPAQYSLGDLYASFKAGILLGPVGIGVDARGLFPTRIDRAGYDLNNFAITGQGLVTLDLHKAADLPVRAHLNGGFVYQNTNQTVVKHFEDNPDFYGGVDGQLLALASDQWFYNQVIAGLSVEVPLPYVTPFVETWYQTAIGVNDNRGANGKPYDFTKDAHLLVTPGARITLGGGVTFDVAVDIGLFGTGTPTDAKTFVDGTPPLAPLTIRGGITYTFDPFHSGGGTSTTTVAAGNDGQLKGCVTDDAGRPITAAIITSPALGGARIATDEAGCFLTPPIAAGDVQLTVEHQGYEKMVVAAAVEKGKTAETTAKLKGTGGGSVSAPVAVQAGTGTARIVGYVTNKEDETIDAELELWDSSGVKPAGKAQGGGFDLQAAAGSIDVVAKADGYLAQGTSLVVEGGGRGRAAIMLKKATKSKKAILEKDRIATTSKVPFEFKKPRLQSTAEYVLDDVIDIMLRNPALKIRVDVYSEPLGSPADSQRLADDRGAAVVDFLTAHGVWPGRLSAKGVPLAEKEGDKARRVEFVIVP